VPPGYVPTVVRPESERPARARHDNRSRYKFVAGSSSGVETKFDEASSRHSGPFQKEQNAMRRISRIAVLGLLAGVLALGGSALAVAKGHHQHHAKVVDVIKDVKDFNTDSTDKSADNAAAQSDMTTPDSSAEAQQEQADAQNEQVDNQSENQDGQQEGDSAGQAAACASLMTDNVQYDDQTGTCTAETGSGGSDNNSDNGSDNNSDDGTPTTTGTDNGTTTSGQSNQNG